MSKCGFQSNWFSKKIEKKNDHFEKDKISAVADAMRIQFESRTNSN